MENKREIVFSFLVISLFLFSFILLSAQAEAAILLTSKQNAVYNLGDTLVVGAEVSYSEQVKGFVRMVLVCGESEHLMFFSPKLIRTSAQDVGVDFPISRVFGQCYVTVSMEDSQNQVLGEGKTGGFLVTDRIDISAVANKEEFDPGDKIRIDGEAVKANGKYVTGDMVIFIGNLEYSAPVNRGEFSYSGRLPENISPGPQNVTLRVEDKRGNVGVHTLFFSIKQIPTSLTIETNKKDILPDEVLIIKPKLLDQAQGIIEEEVNVRVISSDKVLFMNKYNILAEGAVDSGGEIKFRFPEGASPGEYFIEASFPGLETRETIRLQELEKIDFSLEEDTLTVTNIGNVPYIKTMTFVFKIKEQVKELILDLNLDVGETRFFRVEAPDGTYDLEVKAGEDTTEFEGVALTGGIVGAVDLKRTRKRNTAFWTILIIVIASLLAFLFFTNKKSRDYRIVEEKYSDYPKSEELDGVGGEVEKEKVERGTVDLKKGLIREHKMLGPTEAVGSDIRAVFKKHAQVLAASTIRPSLVYGTKQDVSVLLVSILGLEKLKELKRRDPETYSKALNEYFSVMIKKIKEHQGVADLHGNNLVVMFNVVKQHRHDIAAIKTAQAIKDVTAAFNHSIRKLGASLVLKAGINSGLVTVASIKEDKTLKYTAIGNTTNLASSLRDKASANEILITGSVYSKVSNVITAKKVTPLYIADQKAIEVYSLQDTVNLEKRHQWFIDRALGKSI